MANKITVKFEAQGSKALKSAIDQLHLSQVRLEKGTKEYANALKNLNAQTEKTGKGLFDIKNKGRLVNNSFATMRSQLLLASFAFGLVNSTILKLGRSYGEQEQAERRLEGLVGSTVDALKDKASALQQTTRFGDEQTLGAMGLVSAYTTEQAAIAQLTEAAMDLATVKGMDLNTATDMLAKSVFSSTNSMSRYGIEMEGTAGSGARLNSALKAISTQMGGASARDTETLLGALDQMHNAVGDLGERMGKILAPVILAVADATKTFADSIDSEEIKSYASAIAISATAYLSYTTAVALATKGTLLFTKATKKNLIILGATIAISELIDMTNMFASETEDLASELDNLNVKISDNDDLNKKKINTDLKIFDNDTKKALLATRLEMLRKIQNESEKKMYDQRMKQLDIDLKLAFAQQEKQRLDEREGKMTSKQIEGIDHFIKKQEALIKIDELKIQSGIEEMKMQEKKKALFTDLTNQGVKDSLKLTGQLIKDEKRQKQIAFLGAMVDVTSASIATFKKVSKVALPPAPQIAAIAQFAVGSGLAAQILKFEQGGLVGGRRHSAGGTMIEAERGEFVMSRDAVESIGVNNLERMNEGGGASIIINNPIISSDFVETELPELIAEAVRKGADFGMS
tara:strand:- start:912 stop:2807 length:1896 start_codon:yes stop_codon:yes gene_type:complete